MTDSVNVTITPSAGTANIIKGGVAVGATTTTAGLNETLAFTLTAPTTIGTKNTATINIGPDVYTWWVGYADSAKEARAFVTSTIYSANFGGLSGGDSICVSRAAASPYGLSSKWKAMLSDSSNNLADRIPWNWGVLKTVTGGVIADSGFTDLLDGNLDIALNVTELGGNYNGGVHTGSNSNGLRYYPGQTASFYWAQDWTDGSCQTNHVCGNSPSTSIGLYSGPCGCSGLPIYCIEDIGDLSDTIPDNINLTYAIQVPVSSRQVSTTVVLNGMSNGVTTNLSVAASGGNPTFTVNGGSEVTSATVQNGNSIVFRMDAPATGGASNKMTITAGGSTIIGYWRVWSGWDGVGSGIKRLFVTSTDVNGGSFGGVAGADPVCQARAAAAALGGTWKAVLSGIAETEWAVNRVGYNWNELRLVDGTTVAYAPNLWGTLLTPVVKTESGTTKASAYVYSGTATNGSTYSSVAGFSNLNNWTLTGTCSGCIPSANSSSISISTTMANYCPCGSISMALYCIEQ